MAFPTRAQRRISRSSERPVHEAVAYNGDVWRRHKHSRAIRRYTLTWLFRDETERDDAFASVEADAATPRTIDIYENGTPRSATVYLIAGTGVKGNTDRVNHYTFDMEVKEIVTP